ncbi:MAG: hypothetical protein EXR72_20790, partial [Myxococcales bacterium]|nr:hypothetical protein [Myxococcales bacterium]
MRSDNKSGNAWVYPYRGDKWRVYFRVAGRLSGSKAFATEAEAEAEADRIRAEITMRSRSVGSAVDAYLDDMRLRSRREGSIKNADRALRT